MKTFTKSVSEQNKEFFLQKNFSGHSKPSLLLKQSKTVSLSHNNKITNSELTTFQTNYQEENTQQEYFPELINTKKKTSFTSKLHKIQTIALNKRNTKTVKFENNPNNIELASELLYMGGYTHEQNEEKRTENAHSAYLISNRSKSTENIFDTPDSEESEIKLSSNLSPLLTKMSSEQKKGLKEKVDEYHIIKQYRKNSFVQLITNAPPQKKLSVKQNVKNPLEPLSKRKRATNPFDFFTDPHICLNLKKFRLAKFIVTNLKIKEELFINEEKKIRPGLKNEILIQEFYSDNPIYHIYEMPDLINQAMMQYKNYDIFFESLTHIAEKAFETKDRELYLYICKLTGKLNILYGEYMRSLVIYKQCLHDCEKYDLLRIKMSIYKRIGRLYITMQDFDKAKNNFLKMLHLALILKSKNYEILAYDYLGIIYYYKSDMKKAIYFHNRMLKGQLEGDHSLLREVAFTKLNTKKNMNKNKNIQINFENMNCSSSSEHDSNFFDIKSEDMIENYSKDYKRIFVERRKKTELGKLIQQNKGKIIEDIKYTTQLYKLNEIPNSKFLVKAEDVLASNDFKDRLYKTLKTKGSANQNQNKEENNYNKKEKKQSSRILSHLSCNRSMNNFYYNLKNAGNSILSNKFQSQKFFLNKVDEIKILNCMIFLKKNVFLAVNTVKNMANLNSSRKYNLENPEKRKFGRRKGLYLG